MSERFQRWQSLRRRREAAERFLAPDQRLDEVGTRSPSISRFMTDSSLYRVWWSGSEWLVA